MVEGSATLLLYNLSFWLSKPTNPLESPYFRTRWVFSHSSVFWINSILCTCLLLYGIFHLELFTLVFLGFVAVLSLSYGLPIWKVNGKSVGLRQVPGLKVFHIAVIWSLSNVGLPVVELWSTGQEVNWFVANYLGLLKVLFLVMCTLPFDIRDIKQDSYYHLKTIPVLIGEHRATRMCYYMLLFHSILIAVGPYGWMIKMGLLLTNLSLGLVYKFIIFSPLKKYNTVYWLDLMLIVQFVFCLLSIYFLNV